MVSTAPGSEGTSPTCGPCLADPAEYYNIGLFIISFVNRLKKVKILFHFAPNAHIAILCNTM